MKAIRLNAFFVNKLTDGHTVQREVYASDFQWKEASREVNDFCAIKELTRSPKMILTD